MKITDLRTVPLAMPLDKPIGNATAQIAVFSYVAIYLDTDAGITGENLIFTIRPEQVKLLDAMVHVLRDAVIGRSPDDTAAFWAEAWKRINFIGFAGVSIMGMSAIDGAMWDLRGKAAGSPSRGSWGARAKPCRPMPVAGFGSASRLMSLSNRQAGLLRPASRR